MREKKVWDGDEKKRQKMISSNNHRVERIFELFETIEPLDQKKKRA